jgi:hypothetical protein
MVTQVTLKTESPLGLLSDAARLRRRLAVDPPDGEVMLHLKRLRAARAGLGRV